MIIGIFLRNIKTYQGINYIPLSNGESFCGLLGENGIGKSSVLEALDCFFNHREWNYNISSKKSGLKSAKPYIVPIFLVEKKSISGKNTDLAERLSYALWSINEEDIIHFGNKTIFKLFEKQRKALIINNFSETHYLLPIGEAFDSSVNLSIFNTGSFTQSIINEIDTGSGSLTEDQLDSLKPLLNEIKELFEYIYIPKDIDPESFIQLQTREIQALMGENLSEILQRIVTPTQIQKINSDLNTFLEDLSTELKKYSFRTPTDRQQNIRKNDIYSLIIESFFNIRKLHKKEGSQWLEISYLSSGEKQKAIIDLANNLIRFHRKKSDNLIFAIDEPESSLHMSACYDQFSTLYTISQYCEQLLFTTHWYGFIPTTEKGYVSVITKKSGEHHIDLVNIAGYRESIKQEVKSSKGLLPFDIKLKSLNDFVQSILTSTLTDDPYNWLICEGSSERIYFEKYFESIITNKKLRIIPVGGASEIKKIYKHLEVSFEDFRKEIKGKVILVSDTDRELVSYPTKEDSKNLICRRIVNDDAKRATQLVLMDSNSVSPKTEIEDCLNGWQFMETLLSFKDKYPELLSFINDTLLNSEDVVHYAFDFKQSEMKKIEEFFNMDNNKYDFAVAYSNNISSSYKTPLWIEEIGKFFE